MLNGHVFIAGASFSIADIWLHIWLDFAASVKQPFNRALHNITPWFDRIAERPSAEASLHPDWHKIGVRG